MPTSDTGDRGMPGVAASLTLSWIPEQDHVKVKAACVILTTSPTDSRVAYKIRVVAKYNGVQRGSGRDCGPGHDL